MFLLATCSAPYQPDLGGDAPVGSFSVSGTITGAAAGVQVRAFGPTNQTAVTGGAGAFSFSNMAAGEYRFEIKVDGYFYVPVWGENKRTVTGVIADLNFRQYANNTVDAGFTGDFSYINEIQGKTHFSPFQGQEVEWIPGIITARRQFIADPSASSPTVQELYIQNPWPDNDEITSEGFYLNTTQYDPSPVTGILFAAGDFIVIKKVYIEESKLNYPSGSDYVENMTRTQAAVSATNIVRLGTTFTLPPPILIGPTGRMPPNQSMQADTEQDILVPERDMLDFMESLEHMRVQVYKPLTVGHTDEFASTSVVVDHGRHIKHRSQDGGVLLRPDTYNPEIIFFGNNLGFAQALPRGALFQGDIVGIVDYSYRQYKIYPTQALPAYLETIVPRVGSLAPTTGGLTVAGFNVENLAPVAAPNGDPGKMSGLAKIVGDNLLFPDIIGLVEIQDSSGNLDDGTVSADVTLNELEAAIDFYASDLQRYDYEWRQISPIYNTEGGEPGGNIRVGFMFNTKRVSFVDRAPDPVLDPNFVQDVVRSRPVEPVYQNGEWVLSHSPGRIAPGENDIWSSTRRTLAGEFLFQGQRVIVLANHWTAKGGDAPLQGNIQPPILYSEERRMPQAQLVADWVRNFLNKDPKAKIIALGDFNDFQWSAPLKEVEKAGMTNLVWTLPENRRFSYVYNGNAQVLDNYLVTPELLKFNPEFDIVQSVTKFASGQAATDHEPLIARFNFSQTPITGIIASFKPTFPNVQGKVFRISATVKMTNPARLFYAVVPAGTQSPSAYEIREGRRNSGGSFLSGGGVYYSGIDLTLSAPYLLAGGNYDFYLVPEGAPYDFGPVLKFNRSTVTTSSVLATELFISEIVEGSGDNKAVEVANFTNAPIALGGYSLQIDKNWDNITDRTLALPTMDLLPGQVFAIADNSAEPAVLGAATSSTSNFFEMNGNDIIYLYKGVTKIDQFGGGGTAQGGADFYKDATFVRTSLVSGPNSGANDPRVTGEWIIYPRNSFGDLGRHTYDP